MARKKKRLPSTVFKTSVKTLALNLPTYLFYGKGKKRVGLSLNWYRNAHYAVNNSIKKQFGEKLKGDLKGIYFKRPLRLTYTYYHGTNTKSDVMNWTTIADKFLCDALVFYQCIPDDNYDFIKEVCCFYGGFDKNNGRIEVNIEEI